MDKIDLILERLEKLETDVNAKLEKLETGVNAKLGKLETDVNEKLEKLETEVVKTNLTIENEITPQISILVEAVQGVNRKLDSMPTAEDLEITNSRIDTLEAIVKRLSRDVANLKKAQ